MDASTTLLMLMKQDVAALKEKATQAYIRQQTCTDPTFDEQLIRECLAANQTHANAQAALESYLQTVNKTRN